jgi:hypothetical protein
MWTRQQAERRRERIRTQRDALNAALGGKCAICGSTERLEIDHYPALRDYEASALSWKTRLARYEAEARAGKVRLVCQRCNRVAGGCIGALRAGKIMSEG